MPTFFVAQQYDETSTNASLGYDRTNGEDTGVVIRVGSPNDVFTRSKALGERLSGYLVW